MKSGLINGIGRIVSSAAITLALVGGIAGPAQAQRDANSSAPRLTAAAGIHNGMTWRVISQRSDGVVAVGADDLTDAYKGDTPPQASLPMLCLYVDNSAPPSGIQPDFYYGWARGWIGLTPAVSGSQLTSRAAADALCTANFGSNWRMAEFHDGWYGHPPSRGGWHFWAKGVIPSQTRFWVAIDDQAANPWN